MGNIQLVKSAVKLVVGAGTGHIVKNAIKATTPSNISKITKACIGVGGFVMGSMVTDMITDYTEDKMTEMIDSIKEQIADKAITEDEEQTEEEA